MLNSQDHDAIRYIIRDELARAKRKRAPSAGVPSAIRDDLATRVAGVVASRNRVTIGEVLAALGVGSGDRNRAAQVTVGAALRACGWCVAGRSGSGDRERFYRRTAAPVDPQA